MNKNIHVIIPAAGKGTRMRPLSNNLSKTLIPVNGKPILSWILDELNSIKNISSITIVTKETENSENDIEFFVKNTYDGTEIGSKIIFAHQDFNYNGPGGAIISALKEISYKETDGVLIWLGDTICKYNKFDFSKDFLATSKTPAIESKRWCIAEFLEDNTLKTLHDKEILNYADELEALIGIYYMKSLKDFYNHAMTIKENVNEIQISEILNLYGYSNFNKLDLTDYWYDCGELETYYKSRARLINCSAREQSNLYVDLDTQTVTKSSNTEANTEKLKKEFEWFKECKEMRLQYIPKIIEENTYSEKYSYTMSYESGISLSDMWCYENIDKNTWVELLKKIIKIYHTYFIPNTSIYYRRNEIFKHIESDFYIKKCLDRFNKYNDLYSKYISKEDLDIPFKFFDKMKSINHNVSNHLVNTLVDNNLIHGDFHFGNILYDSILNKFTFLDPRGGDFWKSFTDSNYDIAKLYHDIYCGYMLIMQNLYKVENNTVVFSSKNTEMMKYIEDKIDSLIKFNYDYNPLYIKALSISLVFSCVPFHMDNEEHCKAFILRSIYLMKEFLNNNN